ENIGLVTPLVLDLAGMITRDSNLGDVASAWRRASLIAPAESSVRFDLLGDGHALKTGWIRPGAALLAIDLDGDGRIASGAELFGAGTELPNGDHAIDGFAALAQYDANQDDFIDVRDPVYPRLLTWEDGNGDGISQPHELKALAQIGITS